MSHSGYARIWGHLSFYSKLHAKRKEAGDRGLEQTKVYECIMTFVRSLAASVAEPSLKAQSKGKLFAHVSLHQAGLT